MAGFGIPKGLLGRLSLTLLHHLLRDVVYRVNRKGHIDRIYWDKAEFITDHVSMYRLSDGESMTHFELGNTEFVLKSTGVANGNHTPVSDYKYDSTAGLLNNEYINALNEAGKIQTIADLHAYKMPNGDLFNMTAVGALNQANVTNSKISDTNGSGTSGANMPGLPGLSLNMSYVTGHDPNFTQIRQDLFYHTPGLDALTKIDTSTQLNVRKTRAWEPLSMLTGDAAAVHVEDGDVPTYWRALGGGRASLDYVDSRISELIGYSTVANLKTIQEIANELTANTGLATNTRLDQMDALNTTQGANIQTNTDNIATNVGSINNHTATLGTHSGLITANTATITTNAGNIATNTISINTLSGTSTTQGGTITSNSAAIGDIQTAFRNLALNLGFHDNQNTLTYTQVFDNLAAWVNGHGYALEWESNAKRVERTLFGWYEDGASKTPNAPPTSEILYSPDGETVSNTQTTDGGLFKIIQTELEMPTAAGKVKEYIATDLSGPPLNSPTTGYEGAVSLYLFDQQQVRTAAVAGGVAFSIEKIKVQTGDTWMKLTEGRHWALDVNGQQASHDYIVTLLQPFDPAAKFRVYLA